MIVGVNKIDRYLYDESVFTFNSNESDVVTEETVEVIGMLSCGTSLSRPSYRSTSSLIGGLVGQGSQKAQNRHSSCFSLPSDVAVGLMQ